MERAVITDLLRRVRRIERQLGEVRQSLEQTLEAEPTSSTPSRRRERRTPETEEELKKEYLELRERFVREGRRSVDEFANGKSGAHLDRLIAANELPVSTRKSKDETVEELVNYLARSVFLRGT